MLRTLILKDPPIRIAITSAAFLKVFLGWQQVT